MKHDLTALSIVPPVSTPLRENGSIDVPAITRIATHLEKGGIDAAFILGSTGELASLSHSSRIEMIQASCEVFVRPVLVGIGDSCLEESLELAKAAAKAGAAAVVLHPPAYFEISSSEACRYLDLILPRIELPVYLYNMPWLTGFSFDRDTVRCGLQHSNVAGIKDSSGQIETLQMLLEECSGRPDISILPGNEFIFLEALQAGAHGVVGGGSNLYPALFRELLDAFKQGDLATATACQNEITRLGEAIFSLNGNPGSGFSTIKAGLAALGLCEPHMAPPLTACPPDVRETIASLLSQRAVAA